MPWFQRKARPWDSHFDLYTLFLPVTVSGDPYRYHVPEDLYLQLTQFYCKANFGLVGVGVIHYPYISCFRGDYVRWSTPWNDKVISGVGRTVIFGNVPLNTSATKNLQTVCVPLPTPCYLIPSDILEIGWFAPQAGDLIYHPYLSFKSWRIY